MLGTLLSTLKTLPYLALRTTTGTVLPILSRGNGPERLSNLPKDAQLERGRAGIQIRVRPAPKPKLSATLCPSHSCLLLTFFTPQWPNLFYTEVSLSNGPFPIA